MISLPAPKITAATATVSKWFSICGWVITHPIYLEPSISRTLTLFSRLVIRSLVSLRRSSTVERTLLTD